MVADDGIRVFIDGNPVYERWQPAPGTTDLIPLDFNETTTIELTVEYYEHQDNATFVVDLGN